MEQKDDERRWPYPELLAQLGDDVAAMQILDLLFNEPKWVGRRTEALSFESDTAIRRTTEVQLIVPEQAPRLKIDRERYRVIPLAYIRMARSGVLSDFNLTDEAGSALPVLPAASTKAVACSVLESLGRQLFGPGFEHCGDPDCRQILAKHPNRSLTYNVVHTPHFLTKLPDDDKAARSSSPDPADAQWNRRVEELVAHAEHARKMTLSVMNAMPPGGRLPRLDLPGSTPDPLRRAIEAVAHHIDVRLAELDELLRGLAVVEAECEEEAREAAKDEASGSRPDHVPHDESVPAEAPPRPVLETKASRTGQPPEASAGVTALKAMPYWGRAIGDTRREVLVQLGEPLRRLRVAHAVAARAKLEPDWIRAFREEKTSDAPIDTYESITRRFGLNLIPLVLVPDAPGAIRVLEYSYREFISVIGPGIVERIRMHRSASSADPAAAAPSDAAGASGDVATDQGGASVEPRESQEREATTSLGDLDGPVHRPRPDIPEERFRDRLAQGLGLKPWTIWTPIPAAPDARRFHFVITPPAGMEVRMARMLQLREEFLTPEQVPDQDEVPPLFWHMYVLDREPYGPPWRPEDVEAPDDEVSQTGLVARSQELGDSLADRAKRRRGSVHLAARVTHPSRGLWVSCSLRVRSQGWLRTAALSSLAMTAVMALIWWREAHLPTVPGNMKEEPDAIALGQVLLGMLAIVASVVLRSVEDEVVIRVLGPLRWTALAANLAPLAYVLAAYANPEGSEHAALVAWAVAALGAGSCLLAWWSSRNSPGTNRLPLPVMLLEMPPLGGGEVKDPKAPTRKRERLDLPFRDRSDDGEVTPEPSRWRRREHREWRAHEKSRDVDERLDRITAWKDGDRFDGQLWSRRGQPFRPRGTPIGTNEGGHLSGLRRHDGWNTQNMNRVRDAAWQYVQSHQAKSSPEARRRAGSGGERGPR